MGMTIAISNLYMNKMPHSCKECPLTYLDTGDDAYFGTNESRCIIDGSCIDGMGSERAYDCPLVEAIQKDQYDQRLKDDMEAALANIKHELEEHSVKWYVGRVDGKSDDVVLIEDIEDIFKKYMEEAANEMP